MKKREYRNKETAALVAKEPAVAYQTKLNVELFGEDGHRQYYTVDEYAENLRKAINQHYGCELIAKQ